MRPRIIWTIYRKEFTESLRDRRTLFMMVVLPVLLYPLMLIGISKVVESQSEAQKAHPSRVAVWGELPAGLEAQLRSNPRLELKPWGGVPAELRRDLEAGRLRAPVEPTREEENEEASEKRNTAPDTPVVVAARPSLIDRRFDAVLVAWPGLATEIETGRLGEVSILFDAVRDDSRKARQRLDAALGEYRKQLVKRREVDGGLAQGFATALAVHRQNVAPSKRMTGFLLGMALPYILLMFSILGAFYSAIDLTAGEKERGTMQTLLCAPVRPIEIIAGKFLAVWNISVVASLVNILGIAATFARIRMPGLEISFSLASYATAFLLLAPVSFLVTSVFLAVGAFAKDYKDGQNFLTPVMMALLIPLSITSIPGVEANAWTAFVPVTNVALLIKAVLLGETRPDLIFLTLLSSALYASVGFLFAVRVFERENILLGGKVHMRALLEFRRRPGAQPTAGFALFAFVLVLVLAFYGSLMVEKSGALKTLLAVEYGFFLLPCLALVAAARFPFAETLALRRPPLRGLVAAVVLGCSAWTVGVGVFGRLLPPPDSLVRALEKLLLIDQRQVPLWALWLVVALTPALCEELFFRGLLLSGFRKIGMWPAVLVTALLFGLAHASIYRLLPTLWLGIVLGYVVWKTRSIVCGIVVHTLNNGLMVTFARSRPIAGYWEAHGTTALPWGLTVAGIALAAAAFVLLRRMHEDDI